MTALDLLAALVFALMMFAVASGVGTFIAKPTSNDEETG